MREVAEVEAELRELSRDPSLVRRSNSLSALADALQGEDAHLWAKVNLFDAFGEESLVVEGERALTNRLAALEIVRNFAILLPLLWTWFAIGVAISAYSQLLDTVNPSEASLRGAPFIEQWAQGFGGRTSINFRTVAYVDAFLILVVVALSIVVGFQRRRLDVQMEEERTAKWNALREALTQASIILATRAYDTPARFNEELTRLWGRYEGVADNLRDASNQMRRSLEESQAHTAGINHASESLLVAGSSIAAGTDQLNATLEGVRADVSALTAWSEQVAGKVHELAVAHHRLAGRIEDGLSHTTSAAGALQSAAAELPAQVSAVGDQFVTVIRDEMAARSNASEDLSRAGQHAATLAQGLQATSRQFLDAASTLQETASGLPRELSQASAQIASSVDRTERTLSELPQAITTGIDPIRQIPPQLEALEGRYREVESSLGVAAERLNGYSEDLVRSGAELQRTAAAIGAQGDAFPAQLQDLRQTVAEVAAACQEVARSISAAAGMTSLHDAQPKGLRRVFHRNGARSTTESNR